MVLSKPDEEARGVEAMWRLVPITIDSGYCSKEED